MYEAQFDDEFVALWRSYGGHHSNDIVELAPSATRGEEQDPHSNQRPAKRKRHTEFQIQELEALYKQCPNPDDNQRKELGQRLSLEPEQIKFWFQNKRMQVKAKKQRHDNNHLKAENEKLRAENIKYRQALANVSCITCGGGSAPTVGATLSQKQRLRIENFHLRKEIESISGIFKSLIPYPQGVSHSLDFGNVEAKSGLVGETYGIGDLLGLLPGFSEVDKPLISELAAAATAEPMGMGQPLWLPNLEC